MSAGGPKPVFDLSACSSLLSEGTLLSLRPGTLPNAGDVVKFDMEPSPNRPGQHGPRHCSSDPGEVAFWCLVSWYCRYACSRSLIESTLDSIQ